MKSKNKICPACGGEAIKDFYRDVWICVTPNCKKCDIFPEDFQ